MNSIFRNLITVHLVIFMIGGGRVCGCELLEIIGLNAQGHHDSCDGHHHEDCCKDSDIDYPADHKDSPDCCDLLLPIEIDLPKSIELPSLDVNVGYYLFIGESCLFKASSFVLQYGDYPPPDDWPHILSSLASLQKFQV